MTFMGGLGGGFESGDPNLHDKIAKLKAKRGAQSGKQRVDEFLEKELHVDPRDLPLNLGSANDRMKEIMEAGNGCDRADLVGNSLGLKAVVFKNSQYVDPANGCPNCGTKTAGGHWISTLPEKGVGEWACYDCDDTNTAPLPDMTVKTVTENDHGGEDWHDLKRCWNAFRKYATLPQPEKSESDPGSPEGQEPVTPGGEFYSFTTATGWQDTTTNAVAVPMPQPDITKHPTGATLRIQKATFNRGDVDVERMYVRIGGLFNDTDIVDLNTMKPIQDVTGWTVIEEL